MRSYIVPVVVGAVAGIVAALAWAYVVFHTQSMWATLTVGVGLAVGLGVRVAHSMTGDAPVKTLAALAALVALGCILLGHYAAVWMTMTRFTTPDVWDEPRWMAYVADEIVAERERRGEGVDWPDGASPGQGVGPADYPADVWEDAVARWQVMPGAERAALRERETRAYRERAAQTRRSAFLQSIAGLRGVYLLLGGIAAYLAVDLRREPPPGE